MSPLNAINKIKSDDLDAIDQFVQSLLVFVNQDVEVEDVKALEEAGALKIFSQDPSKPADVKLLTAQLDHSQTKIVTDDLYNNALVVAGCPRLNDKASGGDTGQARLLGEGWTMAYQRAKQDDLSFIKSERQFLKMALKICKHSGQLVSLKITDIDIKIPRDKYGPKASTFSFLHIFINAICIIEPIIQPKTKAKTISLAPIKSPAAAINLTSPPPIPLPFVT